MSEPTKELANVADLIEIIAESTMLGEDRDRRAAKEQFLERLNQLIAQRIDAALAYYGIAAK